MVTEVNGIPDVSSLHRCMDPGDIRGPTSQNFQAQLDDINVELACFDGGKELGKKVQVGKSSGNTPSIIPMELFCLKHLREVSSEEMGLANDSRKKQVLVAKTQSVEADVQPCRQP